MLPADDSNGQTETKYHPFAERCTPAKRKLHSEVNGTCLENRKLK